MARRFGRRAWIGASAVLATGAAIPAARWLSQDYPAFVDGRYGGLRPDPDGVFDLLEDFSYTILERSGDRMSDGARVPIRPDGMGCFVGEDGAWILTRNHEIPRGVPGTEGPASLREVAYHEGAGGGVSRLVLDPETLARRSSNMLLTGTSMNCSGGPSPWGWLTCEEDPGDPVHGFVFLCDPAAETAQRPQRVDGYGRFRHEAATVHPETKIAYLSEDRPDGCLYRFVPHDPEAPFEGVLQALRVRGRDAEDLTPLSKGERREIDWIDLPHATPEEDSLRVTASRAGAAAFRRGEGICLGGDSVYLCATEGGPNTDGQIWRLDDEGDGGTLEVLTASERRSELEMPDNVVMAPSGTLYIVEDGPGNDYVRGVTPGGETFPLGRNALSHGEIAGVCFSPDGGTMFLNLQEDGVTLAVRGPFDRLV